MAIQFSEVSYMEVDQTTVQYLYKPALANFYRADPTVQES